jgi:Nucleoside 2-deoxyribosyltransferase like
MIALKPPAPLDVAAARPKIFLAGSIEMGAADDWQATLTAALADLDVAVFNPRRDDWDSSWRQSIDDDRFRGQVEWELEGLERADLVAMWFARETKAPVTLLELGLTVRSGRLVVGCPEGYWRRGNVEVVCARFGAPLFGAWGPFVTAARERAAALVAGRRTWPDAS